MISGLHNLDARFGLDLIPDGSVDMIFTDPPYPVISGGSGTWGDKSPKGILAKNDGKIFKHNDIEPEEYAAGLFRVLKSPGHVYVMSNDLNRRPIEDALLAAGFKTHQLLTWKKNNATPSRYYMKNGEFTFFMRKGRAKTINNPGSKAVHDFNNQTRNKPHPTAKPVDLVRMYIENSSQPGDIVLDPFAGAGSTAVAAIKTGRRFVGFEIDPEHYEVAIRRMSVLTADKPQYEGVFA